MEYEIKPWKEDKLLSLMTSERPERQKTVINVLFKLNNWASKQSQLLNIGVKWKFH